MKLRKLEQKDASFMLEWMMDKKINCFFRFNPHEVDIKSVEDFINKSCESASDSYHFAIVDDNDEYLGTVSLKNIDFEAKSGEYAISLRGNAQGKGVGKFGTMKILEFAFNQLNLNRVFLNVLSDNKHAINFYEKQGFIYEGEFCHHIRIRGEFKSLKWYRMMRCEYEKIKLQMS